MVAPFDVFRVEGSEQVLWLEAVSDLATAKALVRRFMRMAPAEYLILSQETGHRLSIKPDTVEDKPASA